MKHKQLLNKLADKIESLQAEAVDHHTVDAVTFWLVENTSLPKILRELATETSDRCEV